MGNTEFSFSDEEFLLVVNKILAKESTSGSPFVPFTSMEGSLDISGLDSLDLMVFHVWLSELFEIPDAATEKFVSQDTHTLEELKVFVSTNCTKTYSYDDLLTEEKRHNYGL